MLARKDVKIWPRWRSWAVLYVWSRKGVIKENTFRSPSSSWSACASLDCLATPVQVWIFTVLATDVPNSWECNPASHENTRMCLINQPGPEGKTCYRVPGRKMKNRSILSLYFLSLGNVVWEKNAWTHLSMSYSCIRGEEEAESSYISTDLSFLGIVKDIGDVVQRTVY